jgi:hypothetical protein
MFVDNREDVIVYKAAKEAEKKMYDQEALDTRELSFMMGKIFGESLTHNICNELNKQAGLSRATLEISSRISFECSL